MRTIINGFITAVTICSKIPMPKVEQNKKNMRYTLCFTPVIGLVIGALLYGWSKVCEACGFGQVCFALVGTVIPLFVRGGMHLEGFMAVFYDLHSHEKGEKKAENRKNLHDGYFAVIAAVGFCMLYAAGLTLIWKREQLLLLGLGCIISETLAGMSIVWFPAARTEGIAYTLAVAAPKKTVRVVLAAILALGFISAVLVQPILGAVVALAAMWVWTYYFYMSKKRFGGITEDGTGFFLCLCELAGVIVIGMVGRIM